MPFIFHSQKHSIFHFQPQQLTPQQLKQAENLSLKNNRSPFQFKVNMDRCKEHPFRGKVQTIENVIQKNGWVTLNKQSLPGTQARRKGLGNLHQKKAKKIERQIQYTDNSTLENSSCKEMLIIGPKQCSQEPRMIHKSNNAKKDKCNSQKTKITNSQQEGSRLIFNINSNPGPGAYSVQSHKMVKSGYIDSVKCHGAIPQKIENKLCSEPQRESIKHCLPSYKTKSLAIFKQKSSNARSKNSGLLAMILPPRSQNQKQVTTDDCQIEEDDYIPIRKDSPGACSYTIKSSLEQDMNTFNVKKSFLPKSPKFSQCKYLEASKTQAVWAHVQEAEKTHKQTELQELPLLDVKKNGCPVFRSGVARQLRFDTQKLCRQEFYYSPKNNMTDVVDSKLLSRNLKFSFGSSLERFKQAKQLEQDPFKYSFSTKMIEDSKANKKSQVFQSTQKREVFQSLNNMLPTPNKYDPDMNSVNKKAERQIFKQLLKSKYRDEVVQLHEKKNMMSRSVAQKLESMIDITTVQKQFPEVDLGRLQKSEAQRKLCQKGNISFGSDKRTGLGRAFDMRKQLDGYHSTSPSWQQKSFNRQYGYFKEQL